MNRSRSDVSPRDGAVMSTTVGRGNEDEMNNLVSRRGEIRSVWLMLGISHRLRVAQIFLLVSNSGGLAGRQE
jgi:hypothetical protein